MKRGDDRFRLFMDEQSSVREVLTNLDCGEHMYLAHMEDPYTIISTWVNKHPMDPWINSFVRKGVRLRCSVWVDDYGIRHLLFNSPNDPDYAYEMTEVGPQHLAKLQLPSRANFQCVSCGCGLKEDELVFMADEGFKGPKCDCGKGYEVRKILIAVGNDDIHKMTVYPHGSRNSRETTLHVTGCTNPNCDKPLRDIARRSFETGTDDWRWLKRTVYKIERAGKRREQQLKEVNKIKGVKT